MVCFLILKRYLTKQQLFMNIKRTFGAILTLLGIVGLIYAGVGVINHDGNTTTLIVVGIIAVVFFFTGISLVRTIKDEA